MNSKVNGSIHFIVSFILKHSAKKHLWSWNFIFFFFLLIISRLSWKLRFKDLRACTPIWCQRSKHGHQDSWQTAKAGREHSRKSLYLSHCSFLFSFFWDILCLWEYTKTNFSSGCIPRGSYVNKLVQSIRIYPLSCRVSSYIKQSLIL